VINQRIIQDYHLTRNLPSLEGTTRLSVHLRFGTVSIRQLVKTALELNETWLNELIWREFFMTILWHYPQVVQQSFKTKYDYIPWRNNEGEFRRWCDGETGYPMVDAGMRELNETGFMHNRVRMITASFMSKHLLIDWRWGEAYFAQKLLDYELSSNNGNWQWAAGCGCDAAPYFRIFNPYEQQKKFDPEMIYIRRWVNNLHRTDYPIPVVEHVFARERALKTYKIAVTQ
jgi:deoxyribodipyrimidine photo-lyase